MMTKPRSDWQADDRAPWVTNSLRARITDLRAAEKRCRNAFTKPYMGEPANYLADAYAEAADLLAAKLRSIQALENGPAVLADATNDPASLSSLRKGAEVDRAGVINECLAAIDALNDFVPANPQGRVRFSIYDLTRAFRAGISMAREDVAALVSGSREDGA